MGWTRSARPRKLTRRCGSRDRTRTFRHHCAHADIRSFPMAIRYDGKVVIVTGAGGGLGRQHALEFARRGARLVINALGALVNGTGDNSAAAEAVVKEITDAGGTAMANGA